MYRARTLVQKKSRKNEDGMSRNNGVGAKKCYYLLFMCIDWLFLMVGRIFERKKPAGPNFFLAELNVFFYQLPENSKICKKKSGRA